MQTFRGWQHWLGRPPAKEGPSGAKHLYLSGPHEDQVPHGTHGRIQSLPEPEKTTALTSKAVMPKAQPWSPTDMIDFEGTELPKVSAFQSQQPCRCLH